MNNQDTSNRIEIILEKQLKWLLFPISKNPFHSYWPTNKYILCCLRPSQEFKPPSDTVDFKAAVRFKHVIYDRLGATKTAKVRSAK